MVTLASESVLSEYWSSKVGQYSYGKLRVRGVQIRGDLSKIVTDSNSAQREKPRLAPLAAENRYLG
eukprot:scaffold24297_cov89-Skeletonema_marinoi.AAC.2